MRKVNWGILSTARINRRLIPAIRNSDRTHLVAVASRNEDSAMAYADEWGIPKYYGSYESMLADADVDVLYVPLPNDLHAEWTVRALHAGKHVLCEKPICQTMDELHRIRQACQTTGRHVMEAFMYLHHPQTQLFKEIAASGELGEIVAMYSEFVSVFNRPSDNYRLDPAKGGGALWDIGVYPVSFFRFIDDTDVQIVSARDKKKDGVDLTFWGTLAFASGITAQFVASFETEYSTRTSVMGTKGRLDITHPYNATHECKAWITRDGYERELELPKAELFSGEVENMNDVVLGLGSPRFSLDDSERVLDVILGLRGFL